MNKKVFDTAYSSLKNILSKKEEQYESIIGNFSDAYLIYVILHSVDLDLITQAISLIKSQKMLYVLIRKTDDEKIKYTALKHISDEQILADILMQEENMGVALKVMYMLKEYKWIGLLPYYSMSDDVRIKAIEYIDNESELKKIADFYYQYETVRAAARVKLNRMSNKI